MQKGFTIVEIIFIVGIFSLLLGLSIPAFQSFQKQADMNSSAEKIIAALRLAQNKTLASEGSSQWGVFFDSSAVPDQCVLFKGSSYSSRDASFDEIYKLSNSVSFDSINLGGGDETIFSKVTGYVNHSGSIIFGSTSGSIKTVYIENSGRVGVDSSSFSDTDRTKDSRHVHFDYSRTVTTSTENIALTFYYNGSSVTETIPIVSNMKSGQIYWEGEVNVNGSIQKIKIHTHRLNNFGTQFCIHRDKRYNDKALSVSVSGDGSGNLIQYGVDGQITNGVSIYVSDTQAQ